MFPARARSSASRLVGHFGGGATATLRVFAGETTVGREKVRTYSDVTVPVAQHRGARKNADGTIVQTVNLQVTIPGSAVAAGTVVDTKALLVLGGRTYVVLSVDVAAPDGVTVASYTLEVVPK